MMRRVVILIVCVFALAGAARAILPPDAVARAPQIKAERYYARQRYEKHLEERQAEAVQAYEVTRADIFTPPWMRTGMQAAMIPGIDAKMVAEVEASQKRNHRIMISIMLLILIGAAAGLVKYVTRDLDKQDF